VVLDLDRLGRVLGAMATAAPDRLHVRAIQLGVAELPVEPGTVGVGERVRPTYELA
jgi:hypothetical protein